jgi:hypothetical protein
MARFAVGQTVETREPTIAVDPGLEPGRHRFQLEVFNEAGMRSPLATAIVEVQRTITPPGGPPDATPGELGLTGETAPPSRATASRGSRSRTSRRPKKERP